MPDLSNLAVCPLSCPPIMLSCDSSAAAAAASSSSSPSRPETLGDGSDSLDCQWNRRLRFPISTRGTCAVIKKERKKGEIKGKSLADHVRDWVDSKVAGGADERECELPFLTSVPKMVRFTVLIWGSGFNLILEILNSSCDIRNRRKVGIFCVWAD